MIGLSSAMCMRHLCGKGWGAPGGAEMHLQFHLWIRRRMIAVSITGSPPSALSQYSMYCALQWSQVTQVKHYCADLMRWLNPDTTVHAPLGCQTTKRSCWKHFYWIPGLISLGSTLGNKFRVPSFYYAMLILASLGRFIRISPYWIRGRSISPPCIHRCSGLVTGRHYTVVSWSL